MKCKRIAHRRPKGLAASKADCHSRNDIGLSWSAMGLPSCFNGTTAMRSLFSPDELDELNRRDRAIGRAEYEPVRHGRGERSDGRREESALEHGAEGNRHARNEVASFQRLDDAATIPADVR